MSRPSPRRTAPRQRGADGAQVFSWRALVVVAAADDERHLAVDAEAAGVLGSRLVDEVLDVDALDVADRSRDFAVCGSNRVVETLV